MKKFDFSQLKGLSEIEAEEILMKELGEIPNKWLNPEFRAKFVSGGMIGVVTEANLTQFEQSYKNRLGQYARVIGYRRNIEGQGLSIEKR